MPALPSLRLTPSVCTVDNRGTGVNDDRGNTNHSPMYVPDYAAKMDPYYNSYPLQMFDRKIRTLSNVYVGLVATKRALTPDIRNEFKRRVSAANLSGELLAHLDNVHVANFYTFEYTYFSERQLWQEVNGGPQNDTDSRFAEPPTRKALGHVDDKDGSDPYAGMSKKQYEGLVGAWRVGKVLDVAARTRAKQVSGPIDTADALTVDVCIEWCDWRALRRSSYNGSIGKRVPGALEWAHDKNDYKFWTGGRKGVDNDDGNLFLWPTEYTPVSKYQKNGYRLPEPQRTGDAADEVSNMSVNPDAMQTDKDEFRGRVSDRLQRPDNELTAARAADELRFQPLQDLVTQRNDRRRQLMRQRVERLRNVDGLAAATVGLATGLEDAETQQGRTGLLPKIDALKDRLRIAKRTILGAGDGSGPWTLEHFQRALSVAFLDGTDIVEVLTGTIDSNITDLFEFLRDDKSSLVATIFSAIDSYGDKSTPGEVTEEELEGFLNADGAQVEAKILAALNHLDDPATPPNTLQDARQFVEAISAAPLFVHAVAQALSAANVPPVTGGGGGSTGTATRTGSSGSSGSGVAGAQAASATAAAPLGSTGLAARHSLSREPRPSPTAPVPPTPPPPEARVGADSGNGKVARRAGAGVPVAPVAPVAAVPPTAPVAPVAAVVPGVGAGVGTGAGTAGASNAPAASKSSRTSNLAFTLQGPNVPTPTSASAPAPAQAPARSASRRERAGGVGAAGAPVTAESDSNMFTNLFGSASRSRSEDGADNAGGADGAGGAGGASSAAPNQRSVRRARDTTR